MSKAFFKPHYTPQLIYRRTSSSTIDRGHHSTQTKKSLEVWTTTCIVTNFANTTNCSILINPSNAQLSGVRKFPYFPKGGPVPQQTPKTMHKDWQPLGFVSTWGNMSVGPGMLYPVSVVDGLVHEHGGWSLRAECAWKRFQVAVTGNSNNKDVCPIGTAVQTSPGITGRLRHEYNAIVHTTPPFYKYDTNPKEKLFQCYQSAFQLAFAENNNNNDTTRNVLRVACPLLGAGARGFPQDVALDVASKASVEWLSSSSSKMKEHNDTAKHSSRKQQQQQQAVVFGLLEQDLAEQLAQAMDQALSEMHEVDHD